MKKRSHTQQIILSALTIALSFISPANLKAFDYFNLKICLTNTADHWAHFEINYPKTCSREGDTIDTGHLRSKELNFNLKSTCEEIRTPEWCNGSPTVNIYYDIPAGQQLVKSYTYYFYLQDNPYSYTIYSCGKDKQGKEKYCVK